MILPDATVTIDGSERRIRRMAREGLMLLLGDDVEPTALTALAQSAGNAPISVLRLRDLDTTGSLQSQLRPAGHDAWIIRPDAYVAAVCDARQPEVVAAALRKAIGVSSGAPADPPAPSLAGRSATAGHAA